MKQFVAVLAWSRWYGYEAAVYRVKAKTKSAAEKKARAFAKKTLELSIFNLLVEEVTPEKSDAIMARFFETFQVFDKSKEFHVICPFWRAACFSENSDGDDCEI